MPAFRSLDGTSYSRHITFLVVDVSKQTDTSTTVQSKTVSFFGVITRASSPGSQGPVEGRYQLSPNLWREWTHGSLLGLGGGAR